MSEKLPKGQQLIGRSGLEKAAKTGKVAVAKVSTSTAGAPALPGGKVARGAKNAPPNPEMVQTNVGVVGIGDYITAHGTDAVKHLFPAGYLTNRMNAITTAAKIKGSARKAKGVSSRTVS